MNTILIRCDASSIIGSGHVIRCRTLARELKNRGAEVKFLCRQQHGDLINQLKAEFEVFALPKQSLSKICELKKDDSYNTWLGCSQEKDATQCLELLSKAGITSGSWVVADHYGIDVRWENRFLSGLSIGTTTPKLLVIDDLANRPHRAEILLDQNYFGEVTNRRYVDLVPPECRQLLGPHYALLGPEYGQLCPLIPKRIGLKRVLVFFGGVDRYNLTGRALEALHTPELAEVAVDVVIGLQSPHRQKIKELVTQRPNTILHEPLPSLAGLISRADLAIGAGGTTTWERICLKLPSQVVVVAANQLDCTEALDEDGYLELLGDGASVTTEQIRSALLTRVKQQSMSAVKAPLTDGWGTSRLAMGMLGPRGTVKLREARATDEGLLLTWANDPQVRSNSFRKERITTENHHHWFKKSLLNPNRVQLIVTTENGCSIGQIRFDRKDLVKGEFYREARLSLSLDRCARGYGLAVEVVKQGLEIMKERWGPTTEAIAEVLPTNKPSNACFERTGFVLETSCEVNAGYPAGPINRWRWRAKS